ncbi:MAG: DUF2157 domain-containing protein [Bernardetiaceae bacterium]|nr:DUF2157 domain-containing protein [Bernardetiaceae bacterium]
MNIKDKLAHWVAQSLISQEQAAAIWDYEEAQAHSASAPWYRDTNLILRSVAILFAVAALFLLVASNWDSLPIAVRMLMGLLPFLGAITWGGWSIKKNNELNTELAFSLTTLLFGLNIMLQAQIFHISSYFPDGILWWIMGAIPIIIYFRSVFLTLVFQTLFVVWMVIELSYTQFSFASILFISVFVYINYLKPRAILFLSNLISIFIFTMYFAFFAVKNIGLNIEVVRAFFLPSSIAAYMLLGWTVILLYRQSFSDFFYKLYKNIFYLGMLLFLYIFSFWIITEEFMKFVSETNSQLYIFKIFVSLFWIILIGITCFFIRKKNQTLAKDYYIAAAFTLFCFSMLLFSGNFVVVFFILIHIGFLGFASWSIYEGMQQRHKGSFMIGIFLLIVWAAGRYFVLIDNYIITALLLFLSAVLIYGMNLLWNKKIQKNSNN